MLAYRQLRAGEVIVNSYFSAAWPSPPVRKRLGCGLLKATAGDKNAGVSAAPRGESGCKQLFLGRLALSASSQTFRLWFSEGNSGR